MPDSNNQTYNGFILTAHHRDHNGHFEITIWAAGAHDDRAKIVVNNFRPMFFCGRDIPEDATASAVERKQIPLKTLDNDDVDCLYFATYSAMQQCAKNLRAGGHKVYESDINPLDRYLMERMVCGAITLSGAAAAETNAHFSLYKNPHLRGDGFKNPKLRVMSVHIDGGENGEPIREIACADNVHSHVFDGGERALVTDFFAYVKLWDPDVLVGADIAKHTLRIVSERCAKLGIPFDVGRESGSRIICTERAVTWRDGYNATRIRYAARVPGRVVMDAKSLLRNYHQTFDENLLDNRDTVLNSAKNTLQVFKQTEMLPNAVERSLRGGQLLGATGGSVASFDHVYLPRLHRAGFVAADTRDIAEPKEPLHGGHVIEPAGGLYENVLVFDFKSLYPSIIITFKIDPLGFKIRGGEKIIGPAKIPFSKDISILADISTELLSARAQAQRDGNACLSQAIKILMNSFYGVLGSTGCRFFSEELSHAITATGRYVLTTTIKYLEDVCGRKVIYGDTDSIFVNLGAGAENNAQTLGADIAANVNAWLADHVKKQFDAESKLELKFETHYRKFFIPSKRHGGDAATGTKKHYCGGVLNDDGEYDLTFKGMESARSDWTLLAKEFQSELYKLFFAERPLDDYIISTVNRLSSGEFDGKLVYKKRARKNLDDYVINIPPHVAAAKLLDAPVRVVKYCITKNGPQPVEKLTAPLDHAHYIDTQIAPIANSILGWSGRSFEETLSGQQNLF